MTRPAKIGFGLALAAGIAGLASLLGGAPREEPSGAGGHEGSAAVPPTLRGRAVLVDPETLRRQGPVAVLPGERSASFRVVDDAGHAVAHARVLVTSKTLGRLLFEDLTGPLDLGQRWLDAHAEVIVESPRDANGLPLPLRPLVVRLAASGTGDVPLRLERGREAEVRVMDDRGDPVARAHVHVLPADPDADARALFWNTPSWAFTDAGGTVRFEGLPRVALEVEVEGQASWEDSVRTPLPVGVEAVVVVRDAGRTIEGTVVGPDGRPVPRVRVTAGGWQEGTWWETGATTDSEGQFRVTGLAPSGTPRLTATPDAETAKALHVVSAIRDDVRTGSVDVVIRLAPAAAIRGEVVDESGRAVPEFEIEATAVGETPPSDPVDAGPLAGTNRFSLDGLAPGRWRLEAVARGADPGRSRPVEVDAPAEGVRVVLERARVIAGRIVDERAKGYFAWWFAPSLKAHAPVEPDDTFRIAGVRDEVGTLYVGSERSDRYALLRDVRPSAAPIDVLLVEGLRVEGRVEIAKGADPALVYVVLAGDGFELWAEMESDRSFHVLGVPPGSYEVSLAVDDVRGPTLARTTAGATDVLVRYPGR
jgi:hypothetical protein